MMTGEVAKAIAAEIYSRGGDWYAHPETYADWARAMAAEGLTRDDVAGIVKRADVSIFREKVCIMTSGFLAVATFLRFQRDQRPAMAWPGLEPSG